MTASVTVDTLQAFADAWNRHDVDALMSFMTDDCVFETSAGPDVHGVRHEGREAVRKAYAAVWQAINPGSTQEARSIPATLSARRQSMRSASSAARRVLPLPPAPVPALASTAPRRLRHPAVPVRSDASTGTRRSGRTKTTRCRLR